MIKKIILIFYHIPLRESHKYLKSNTDICIYVYGKHNLDETAYKKYEQLIQLGFTNAYLYIGGLFEWLLLQDIYGDEDFPTTKKELDILKFKPPRLS